MSSPDLLSAGDVQRVVAAIGAAEELTIGEIRVHIEKRCWGDPYARAQRVFYKLGMQNTAKRTGVLIYIAHLSRKAAIIGDQGINEKVDTGFWKSILDSELKNFASGKFADGICDAIAASGKVLADHFPKTPGNLNELSNEISFG